MPDRSDLTRLDLESEVAELFAAKMREFATFCREHWRMTEKDIAEIVTPIISTTIPDAYCEAYNAAMTHGLTGTHRRVNTDHANPAPSDPTRSCGAVAGLDKNLAPDAVARPTLCDAQFRHDSVPRRRRDRICRGKCDRMPYRPKGSRFLHYDFQIRGRRFHGSCGTEDFQAAKAVETQARVTASAAPQSPPGIFTLSQAVGTYWTDVSRHQPSARTTLSQGKAILATLRLDQIGAADIMLFVTRRRAEVSNATVNRQLQLIGRALRHMKKYHAAKVAPLDLRAAEVAEPKERVRELTTDEQVRLFAKLRTDLHPMAKFALMTGARIGTITGLLWRDVDLAGGRMIFRLKGGGQMTFPVNAEMRAFLSALPRAEGADARHVITFVDQLRVERRRIAPGGGKIMSDLRQALADAEVHDFRFHDLRHTFATRMLRQTGNLKLVSRLLGHSTIETTTRYAHVLDEDLRAALDGYSIIAATAANGIQTDDSRRKSRG